MLTDAELARMRRDAEAVKKSRAEFEDQLIKAVLKPWSLWFALNLSLRAFRDQFQSKQVEADVLALLDEVTALRRAVGNLYARLDGRERREAIAGAPEADGW